jgi:hypothetical protein
MTNFDPGWGMVQNSLPQFLDLKTLGFLPGEGGTLPSVIPGADSLPASSNEFESVRVLVIGSHWGVNYTIRWLYRLNFAQISEWSFLMPAPGTNEMMSILTKRIRHV